MKTPGELVCMVLFGLFVIAVVNAKAERAGGWGNYLAGCVGFVVLLVVIGLVGKGCKAVSGG
jgi:hypothetical protein